MNEHQRIVGLLKRRRSELSLSQQEAAGRVGVALSSYQSWEAGRATPRAGSVRKLSVGLGIPLEDFEENEVEEAMAPLRGQLDQLRRAIERLTTEISAASGSVVPDDDAERLLEKVEGAARRVGRQARLGHPRSPQTPDVSVRRRED